MDWNAWYVGGSIKINSSLPSFIFHFCNARESHYRGQLFHVSLKSGRPQSTPWHFFSKKEYTLTDSSLCHWMWKGSHQFILQTNYSMTFRHKNLATKKDKKEKEKKEQENWKSQSKYTSLMTIASKFLSANWLSIHVSRGKSLTI